MKKILGILALSVFLLSCNGRKNVDEIYSSDIEEVVTDSMPQDSLHHPSPDEFEDGHMSPPPPLDGKGRPPHEPDNMRGFDPASEDDMDDNGMSRYMENNDDSGWD